MKIMMANSVTERYVCLFHDIVTALSLMTDLNVPNVQFYRCT